MEVDGRHIFVSYVREDAHMARRLVASLRSFGFSIWLDEDSLKAGDHWKAEIRHAIASGLGFVACFSTNSENKHRSYMREELLLAIEELRRRPHSQSWFIPILLDDVSIPDMFIGPGETLNDLHYIRLDGDYEHGVINLARALWPETDIVRILIAESERLELSEDFTGSLRKLTLALELSPRDPDLLARRARNLIATGSPEEGIADLEESGRAHWPELSYAYWKVGDLDSSLAILKRLRVTGQSTTQTEFDLGSILYCRRRAEESIAAFDRAKELRPDSLAVRLARTRVALKTNAYIEIAEFSRECQSLYPAEAEFYEAEAISLVFQSAAFQSWHPPQISDVEGAAIVALFEKALDLDDSNPRRYYRAAMCLYKIHRYADARRIGLKGLDVLPSSTSLRVVLAQVAEYGTSDKDQGIDESIRHYDEAAKYPLDDLELEDDFPVLEGDDRHPRPDIPRYSTIPLMIAGVAVASAADYMKHYKDSTARSFYLDEPDSPNAAE